MPGNFQIEPRKVPRPVIPPEREVIIELERGAGFLPTAADFMSWVLWGLVIWLVITLGSNFISSLSLKGTADSLSSVLSPDSELPTVSASPDGRAHLSAGSNVWRRGAALADNTLRQAVGVTMDKVHETEEGFQLWLAKQFGKPVRPAPKNNEKEGD